MRRPRNHLRQCSVHCRPWHPPCSTSEASAVETSADAGARPQLQPVTDPLPCRNIRSKEPVNFTMGGQIRVGGPGPGWGPVRVGARSGLGPIWAHMGPYVFC